MKINVTVPLSPVPITVWETKQRLIHKLHLQIFNQFQPVTHGTRV